MLKPVVWCRHGPCGQAYRVGFRCNGIGGSNQKDVAVGGAVSAIMQLRFLGIIVSNFRHPVHANRSNSF